MIIPIPSLICIVLLVFGLFHSMRYLLVLSFALQAFGCLTVFAPEYSGGVSLLVGTFSELFLLIKLFMTEGEFSAFLQNLLHFRQLGLLSAFTLIAIVDAFALPRLFEGAVNVFPMRQTELVSTPELLAPSAANITQSLYLLISLLITGAFTRLVKHRCFVSDFSIAIIIGAAVIIITGLMDLIASRFNAQDTLSIFRTASYSFPSDSSIGDIKRTVGLMSEASSFGGLATFAFSLLLFTRNIYSPFLRQVAYVPILAGCGLFAVLSTSTTAYVCLMVTFVLYIFDCFWRFLSGNKAIRYQIMKEFLMLGILVVSAAATVSLNPDIHHDLFDLVDQVVFQKSESSSYFERSSWTALAFDAWQKTGGLGVGAGSVRTSNFFVNILASSGYLGFSLFIAFLVHLLISRPPVDVSRLAELVHGAKLAVIPSLFGEALASTTPDYGSNLAVLFGIIIGAAPVVPKVTSRLDHLVQRKLPR